MTRTFSKVYGLGGLRVGWGYGPRSDRRAEPHARAVQPVGDMALAGAEAAVRDPTGSRTKPAHQRR
jgi:histidinol-phosphate aminotransferase